MATVKSQRSPVPDTHDALTQAAARHGLYSFPHFSALSALSKSFSVKAVLAGVSFYLFPNWRRAAIFSATGHDAL